MRHIFYVIAPVDYQDVNGILIVRNSYLKRKEKVKYQVYQPLLTMRHHLWQ